MYIELLINNGFTVARIDYDGPTDSFIYRVRNNKADELIYVPSLIHHFSRIMPDEAVCKYIVEYLIAKYNNLKLEADCKPSYPIQALKNQLTP